MRDDLNDLLTVPDVAELFDVTHVTVLRWARAGRIPGFQQPGGRWRFRRSEIENLIPPPLQDHVR